MVAYAHVKDTVASNVAATLSTTTSFGSAPAATSLIVVWTSMQGALGSVSSIAGTGGTFQRAFKQSGTGCTIDVWWGTGLTGTVLTVTQGSSLPIATIGAEFSGPPLQTTGIVEGAQGATATTTAGAPTVTTATVQPNRFGDLAIAGYSDNGGNTLETLAGTGWNEAYRNNNAVNLLAAWKILTDTAPIACAITCVTFFPTVADSITVFAANSILAPRLATPFRNPLIPM